MTQATPHDDSKRGRTLKIWGVGIVLLMIVVMLFPINLGGGGRGGPTGADSPTVGTITGGRVSAEDRANASRLLDVLDSVYLSTGQGEQAEQIPLTAACWGPDVLAAFRRSPEALHLLLAESRRVGPGASPLTLGSRDPDQRSTHELGIFNSGNVSVDQLHPLQTSPLGQWLGSTGRSALVSVMAVRSDRRSLGPIASLPAFEQRAIFDALTQFLTIQSAASLAQSAVKVSNPVVERAIAERMQRFDMSVASFEAASYLAEVGEPTEPQIAEHFAKFADAELGQTTAQNPFGFGYRIGDRVTLEWIEFDRNAVRAAVAAQKTPYEWEVEARIAYAKDPAPFASLQPATQPTTGPATNAVQQPAGFDAIKEAAVRSHIDRAADARLAEAERRARSVMTSDHQAWANAAVSNAATLPAQTGGAIDAADYLDRLADDIAKRFGVRPTVVRLAERKLDRAGIEAAAPSFAQLSLPPTMLQRPPYFVPGPNGAAYAARAAVVQPTRQSSGAESESLALFQPSRTISSTDGSRIAIFRILSAEPSHAADDLAAARDQVIYDWKVAQATERAFQAAEAALRDRLDSLAWVKATVDASPAAAATLGLSEDAMAQFRTATLNAILSTPIGQPATAAVRVPAARRAYVVRRENVEPMWQSPQELAEQRDVARMTLALRMAQPSDATNPFGLTAAGIESAWMDVDAIYARHGWKATESADAR